MRDLTRRGLLAVTGAAALSLVLSACGGGVGPGEKALIGEWTQVPPPETRDPTRRSGSRTLPWVYAKDGTSQLNGTLIVSPPATRPDAFRAASRMWRGCWRRRC